MRFGKRSKSWAEAGRRLWGDRGSAELAPEPTPEPEPEAADTEVLLDPPAEEITMENHADAPEPEETLEPMVEADPTQRLLTVLGRFQRQVNLAESGAPADQWVDSCVDQVIGGIEIAYGSGWDGVKEALTDTARILQSYDEGGDARSAVPFLLDSYEILCLMVGDLIVDNVRSGVMRKWRERYRLAVEELESAGHVLVADDAEPRGEETPDNITPFQPRAEEQTPLDAPDVEIRDEAQDDDDGYDDMPFESPTFQEPAETIAGPAESESFDEDFPFEDPMNESAGSGELVYEPEGDGTDPFNALPEPEDAAAEPVEEVEAAELAVEEEPVLETESIQEEELILEEEQILEAPALEAEESVEEEAAPEMIDAEEAEIAEEEPELLVDEAAAEVAAEPEAVEEGDVFAEEFATEAVAAEDDPIAEEVQDEVVEAAEEVVEVEAEVAEVPAEESKSDEQVDLFDMMMAESDEGESTESEEVVAEAAEPELFESADALDEAEVVEEVEAPEMTEEAAEETEVVEPESVEETAVEAVAPEKPTAESILKTVQDAVTRGNVADAKVMALRFAADMAILETCKAEDLLEEAKQLLAESEESIAAASERVAESDQQLRETREQRKARQEALAHKQEEVESAESMVTDVEGRITDLEQQIAELQAKLAEENSQLREAQEMLSAEQEEEQRITQEIAQLQSSEQASETLLASANDHAEAMRRQRDEREELRGQREEELRNQRESLAGIEGTLKAVGGDVEARQD